MTEEKNTLDAELKNKFEEKASSYIHSSETKNIVLGGNVVSHVATSIALPMLFIEPVSTSIAWFSAVVISQCVGNAARGVSYLDSKIDVEWQTLSGQTVKSTGEEAAQYKAMQEELIRFHKIREVLPDDQQLHDRCDLILRELEASKRSLFEKVEILDAGVLGASATEITFLTREPKESPVNKQVSQGYKKIEPLAI